MGSEILQEEMIKLLQHPGRPSGVRQMQTADLQTAEYNKIILLA